MNNKALFQLKYTQTEEITCKCVTTRSLNFTCTVCIPANFFWDIGMRFLSWECWDFWRWHDHFRRFQKKSEVFRRRPKAETALTFRSPSLRTRIKASSLPVLFTSKIKDRKEGIAIYSFYTWFLFLTWIWVNIFLKIVSSNMATTHIFQSGVTNWPASVSRREIEVFNPQAWDSRLRCESWQVYVCNYTHLQHSVHEYYMQITGTNTHFNHWCKLTCKCSLLKL